MKNLKTSNFTEFRDISDGLHLRIGGLNMTNLGYAKVSLNQIFNSDKKCYQLKSFLSLTHYFSNEIRK